LRTASGGKRATQTSRMASASMLGTVAKGGKGKPAAPKPARPANSVRPSSLKARKPAGNAIKPYRPVSNRGKARKIDRKVDRVIKTASSFNDQIKKAQPKLNKFRSSIERSNARAIVNRRSPSKIDRMIAGIELGTIGGRSGTKAIQRRMERAAAAAKRGSKAGIKARSIYGNQLAALGPGKPARGKNSIKPGPRNTKGPPKAKRRKGKA